MEALLNALTLAVFAYLFIALVLSISVLAEKYIKRGEEGD